MQSYQKKDHLVIDGKHPNHLSKKLKIEIKATATTVIELSLTYSPLSTLFRMRGDGGGKKTPLLVFPL